jgi:uncharacterized protein YvpB
VRRIVALVLTLVTALSALPGTALAASDQPGNAGAGIRALSVPYRSQLDGSPYAESNCGPASMGMVLAAYGQPVSTLEVRLYVNEVQDTVGMYDAGSFIESLADVATHYGLRPLGLFSGGLDAKGKPALRRWSVDDLKHEIDAGHPVVPQVWYRGLPGRERKPYDGDHYIVIMGYTADEVIYNDPIDKDAPGASRRMSWAQLDKSWRNSDFPYAALSIAGDQRRPSLLAQPAPAPTATPRSRSLLRPFAVPNPLPGPGDMPLTSYPGTWVPELTGVE